MARSDEAIWAASHQRPGAQSGFGTGQDRAAGATASHPTQKPAPSPGAGTGRGHTHTSRLAPHPPGRRAAPVTAPPPRARRFASASASARGSGLGRLSATFFFSVALDADGASSWPVAGGSTRTAGGHCACPGRAASSVTHRPATCYYTIAHLEPAMIAQLATGRIATPMAGRRPIEAFASSDWRRSVVDGTSCAPVTGTGTGRHVPTSV